MYILLLVLKVKEQKVEKLWKKIQQRNICIKMNEYCKQKLYSFKICAGYTHTHFYQLFSCTDKPIFLFFSPQSK
jgi:hypothetical protein